MLDGAGVDPPTLGWAGVSFVAYRRIAGAWGYVRGLLERVEREGIPVRVVGVTALPPGPQEQKGAVLTLVKDR